MVSNGTMATHYYVKCVILGNTSVAITMGESLLEKTTFTIAYNVALVITLMQKKLSSAWPTMKKLKYGIRMMKCHKENRTTTFT